MGSIGWPEIIIIALIVIVLFGGRRLADAGRGMGEAIRNFRDGMKGDADTPPKGGGESKRNGGER
jgi:sec-independent protein translocase protein TatA